jgi:FkbM family methyltransferase
MEANNRGPIEPTARQPMALSMFKLLSPELYQRLRRTPILGWLGRRVLDVSLHNPGIRSTPILDGTLTGMVLQLDPRIHKEMAVGRHEPVVRDCVEHHLNPGDLAFDVGAHLGYMTLVMAKLVGNGGHVVAFEPDPVVASHLVANVGRNTEHLTAMVTTERVAVGAVNGSAAFKRGSDSSTGRLAQGIGDLVVPVITLDDAMSRFGVPRLVKIDVEGGEFDVLLGGGSLLRQGRTIFVIEAHSQKLERECTALLKESGWSCVRLPEPDTGVHIIATPPGNMAP